MNPRTCWGAPSRPDRARAATTTGAATQRLRSVPRRIPLAAAWCCVLPFAAAAQSPAPFTVIVQGNRPAAQAITPAAPDAEQLRRQRATTSDTASLLRDVPGLSLYGAGGVSSLPALRGLADDRLRIQVDGMDLVSACGNHMNPPLSYIDPSNVDSVRVYAGIAPVSASGDSIGGTIQVESAAPLFAAAGQAPFVTGEGGVALHSNGNGMRASVAATRSTETLSVAYNGSVARAEDYQAARPFKDAGPAADDKPARWLGGELVGSSAYKSVNHAVRIALHHDAQLLDLRLGLQDIAYQLYPNQRMDMTGNDSTHANLRWQARYGWGSLEARAYHEQTRHAMQFGDDKQFGYGPTLSVPGMPMDTEGRNSGARVKAELALSERDVVRAGGEWQRYRLNDWWEPSGGGMAPDTFWNINNGRRDRLDVFAEWDAAWSAHWATQLGLRGGRVAMDTGPVQGYNTTMAQYLQESTAFNARDRRRIDHNVDFAAVLRHMPEAGRSYEAGFARKSRSPNLYERYTWSTGGMAMRMINFAGDGNGYVGNPDLRPEVAHTLSASAEWRDAAHSTWSLRIAPYLTVVKDFVDARRCATGTNMCTAANAAATTGFVYLQFANQDARLTGIDISGVAQLAKADGLGEISLSGVLSYVRGKNRSTGDNLYNIMPLNAKLALTQRQGGWTGTLELQAVDAKAKVSSVRNEVATAGYGLVHLRGNYSWGRVRLEAGVENLLDRFYNHPLGGAYLGQGRTMAATAVPWGVPVPGPGRSVYAGVTVTF